MSSDGSSDGFVHHAHAAAAAARRSLQHHRVADALGDFERFFGALQESRPSRAGWARRIPRITARACCFTPMARITSGLGPMNLISDVSQTSAKSAFSLKKAVAGMDGVDVGDLGGADDRGNVEIAARAFGRADADGFVGEAHVQAVAVGFRIDGDGLDAQILAGADDANGDLAAIGDQDFLEHISAGGWRTGPLRTPPAGRFP